MTFDFWREIALNNSLVRPKNTDQTATKIACAKAIATNGRECVSRASVARKEDTAWIVDRRPFATFPRVATGLAIVATPPSFTTRLVASLAHRASTRRVPVLTSAANRRSASLPAVGEEEEAKLISIAIP